MGVERQDISPADEMPRFKIGDTEVYGESPNLPRDLVRSFLEETFPGAYVPSPREMHRVSIFKDTVSVWLHEGGPEIELDLVGNEVLRRVKERGQASEAGINMGRGNTSKSNGPPSEPDKPKAWSARTSRQLAKHRHASPRGHLRYRGKNKKR